MTDEEAEIRRPGRPSSGGPTPTRSLRLGKIYDDAQEHARARDEKVTRVIEEKLANYVADDPVRELYDGYMKEFREVHARRGAWEEATGTLATPATLNREILVPWRRALAQVRLARAQYRMRGVKPPEVPNDMPWLDERKVELKELDGVIGWVQTEAPQGSRFA